MRSTVGTESGMPIAPVMIYGDDVTHVRDRGRHRVSLQGARLEQRRAAIAAVAGVTPIGAASTTRRRTERCAATASSPRRRISGSDPADAKRSLLAAKQHRRTWSLVGRTVRPARTVPELVSAAMATILRSVSARALADKAVEALVAEATLTPKPGLVDRRGPGAHDDMDLELLFASAARLHDGFAQMAEAAEEIEAPNAELRAELARIGRVAEQRMLDVTGGVNTHRGAIWALGLLTAPRHSAADDPCRTAASIASHPDAPRLPRR